MQVQTSVSCLIEDVYSNYKIHGILYINRKQDYQMQDIRYDYPYSYE